MKTTTRFKTICGCLSAALILLCLAATPITQTKDLKINNATDSVALTLQKGTLTANLVEAYEGSALKFAVPATGILGTAYGGTGSATTNGSFDALSPLTTRGDLLTRNATVNTRLGVGSAGQVLKSDGTDWLKGLADLTTNVVGVLPLANGGTAGATAAAAKTALGIQFGSNTTAADGTVTNTFGTAFSSAPYVVTTPINKSIAITNTVISVSSTAFIYNMGADGVVFHFIAIGAP